MRERTFAVIAAEAQELEGLEEFLKEPCWEKGAAGCRYLTGYKDGVRVVGMQCGIGKVNAAVGTQAMIDAYDPDALVNVGSAGAIADDLKIYDIVISEKTVQHDMNVEPLGYAPGVVPGTADPFVWADPVLKGLAEAARREEGLSGRTGCIASGDLFVASPDTKKWLRDTFEADCAEMEGAAVACTCMRNGIPFVIVRSMSDTAGEEANTSYEEFSREASRHAIRLLVRMIRSFAER